jgi:hypothetical protein
VKQWSVVSRREVSSAPPQGVVEICHRVERERQRELLWWLESDSSRENRRDHQRERERRGPRGRDLCRLDRKSSYFYLYIYFFYFIFYFYFFVSFVRCCCCCCSTGGGGFSSFLFDEPNRNNSIRSSSCYITELLARIIQSWCTTRNYTWHTGFIGSYCLAATTVSHSVRRLAFPTHYYRSRYQKDTTTNNRPATRKSNWGNWIFKHNEVIHNSGGNQSHRYFCLGENKNRESSKREKNKENLN